MIKRLLIILILFISLASTANAGKRVAVVLSSHNRVFDSAIDGFNSVSYFTSQEFLLKNIEAEKRVPNIRKYRPDIILAIGKDALESVREIIDIPIVYMFVPNPDTLFYDRNFFGTGMYIDPAVQIETIIKHMPDLKKAGIIYSSNSLTPLIKNYQNNAVIQNIKTQITEIPGPSEFPHALNRMKDQIDHFIMLPDRKVMTSQTLEYLMLFSIRNKIPVIAFSEKYLNLGAVMSITPDIYEIGRQTGRVADLIISGKKPAYQFFYAEKPVVHINKIAAKNLKIRMDGR